MNIDDFCRKKMYWEQITECTVMQQNSFQLSNLDIFNETIFKDTFFNLTIENCLQSFVVRQAKRTKNNFVS
jgi:hypothetical protein